MNKLSVLLLAGLCCTALSATSQQAATKVKTVTLQPTSPASGREMYVNYCASCHGADARGNGPAALALKLPPADLTILSQKNGGKFPAFHVAEVLRSGGTSPAHGSAEMPIWGDVLRSLNSSNAEDQAVVRLRISNLTNYLQSVQK